MYTSACYLGIQKTEHHITLLFENLLNVIIKLSNRERAVDFGSKTEFGQKY